MRSPVSMPTGQAVARGLAMPHSPRLHDGRLWVLDSGRGRLATVDAATGRVEPVAELPGYARGLAFAGPFAFVGLSRIRETASATCTASVAEAPFTRRRTISTSRSGDG